MIENLLTPGKPISEPSPELASAIAAVASMPLGTQDAIREILESANDLTQAGADATLADVLQRVFVRSVGEFFTTQRQSTQMPESLIHYILPVNDGIALPEPSETIEVPLGDVLGARRSVRNFSIVPMTLQELSDLLHHSAGRRAVEAGYGIKNVPLFRYPSIGGLNSVDLGIVVNRVEGIESGFYRYDPVGHTLVMHDRGDLRLAVQDVTFEAEWLFHAQVVLVFIHNQDKVNWKYKTRSLRFSHVDLGALMQNLYLVSTSMNFACCAVAGFFDEGANNLFKLDGTRQFVSLLMGVGPMGRLTLAEPE
ncbi:MAG: hypothetical protein B5766_00505 [Candidatus Lumbricidophila eiseniae]|uniref:Nitroreductase domain-containing protein n=1 Tax=Candidatus Lumbricidiphila eiseniae TaxID=1969409 RepID=A0A2A6FU75_9MICO|nr:MAG: hypothetical protein B5766_00505 [Candidatus Lumbricidophila eiseniae]